EVDVERKRISLTMKLDAAPARHNQDRGPRDNRFEGAGRGNSYGAGGGNRGGRDAYTQPQRGNQPTQQNAMASAFAKLQGLKK
ncbi:MAG: hypothetical protein RR729_07895, partial [Comamonas sp.]